MSREVMLQAHPQEAVTRIFHNNVGCYALNFAFTGTEDECVALYRTLQAQLQNIAAARFEHEINVLHPYEDGPVYWLGSDRHFDLTDRGCAGESMGDRNYKSPVSIVPNFTLGDERGNFIRDAVANTEALNDESNVVVTEAGERFVVNQVHPSDIVSRVVEQVLGVVVEEFYYVPRNAELAPKIVDQAESRMGLVTKINAAVDAAVQSFRPSANQDEDEAEAPEEESAVLTGLLGGFIQTFIRDDTLRAQLLGLVGERYEPAPEECDCEDCAAAHDAEQEDNDNDDIPFTQNRLNPIDDAWVNAIEAAVKEETNDPSEQLRLFRERLAVRPDLEIVSRAGYGHVKYRE